MSEDRTLYFLDTEFIEDGKTIDLLSIGVVCDDGREFYAESVDADWSKAGDWVRANVLPHLHQNPASLRTRPQIATELLMFVNAGRFPPTFWGYYGDYDWVALCQLYGTMLDIPSTWPLFCMDLKQLCVSLGNPRLLVDPVNSHHALADALWNRDAYYDLLNREES